MSETADIEYIQLVLKGNQQAYTALVEKYQHYIFTLAYRMTDSREDAEEITQDVFIKAYKSLADFKGGSKFSTWLYTIGHHTSITFLRKRKINIRSLDDEKQVIQLENMESDFRANTIEDKNRKAAVNQAMAMLSPQDLQILTLFYKSDQSLAEIGQIMAIDPGTVKVRLFRARQKLRERMVTHFSEEVAQLREA